MRVRRGVFDTEGGDNMNQIPTYAPTWLPVPNRPWRLVDVYSGAFWPRPMRDAASKRFKTAEAALAFAEKYKIKLAP